MSTVEAICADLDKLVDGAMWAHAYGYSKAGRGLDAEHGTDLSRTELERERGDVYDLDIGHHKARVAYQGAVRSVSRADRLVAAMLLGQGLTYQLPVDRLDDYAFPFYLRRSAWRLRWRLSRVDEDQHKHRLVTIRSNLDRAVRGMTKALDSGSTVVYTAHRERPCRTCGIRERASKKAECNTCATWRARHDGATRPITLDTGPLNEARAAQARRMARGEGWGVA